MANPPVEHFFDLSVATDGGTGTNLDPYTRASENALQYHLENTITQDASHGDICHCKGVAHTALSSAISLTSYGTPGFGVPLIIRGYTSTAGDGGQATIDCGGFSVMTNAGNTINWMDMELKNGPATGALLTLTTYGACIRCYIHDCDSTGIAMGANSAARGNQIENVGSSTTYDGIITTTACHADFNYIKNGTREMRRAIDITGGGNGSISNNIISVDRGTSGIYCDNTGYPLALFANTVFSDTGTGKGVYVNNFSALALGLFNNYVEGFGTGIQILSSSIGGGMRGYNAVYNNTTNSDIQNEHVQVIGTDPEILTASGLAKTGSDTFANRLAYFAPANEGGMRTGAMQPGGYAGTDENVRAKGAVQILPAGGGKLAGIGGGLAG